MSILDFDPTEMFMPDADELGHKVGQMLPKLFGKFSDVLKSRGLPHELPDSFQRALPRAIKMAAGGTKVSFKMLPEGQIRDVAEKYFNTFLDNIGKGAATALASQIDDADAADDAAGGHKATPDDGGAAKPDPGMQKGYLVGLELHRAGCRKHPRPRPPKGERAPDDITVAHAITAMRLPLSYCDCWGTPSEVEALEAQVKAAIAPGTTAKVETKAEAPASKPEPKPEPKPGSGTLFALLMRLKEDEENQAFFEKVLDLYQLRTAKDPDLRNKFLKAFHENGSYEDLKFLLKQPCTLWGQWLDDYIGEQARKETLFEREHRQNEGMFNALIEQLKGVPAWLEKVSVDEEGDDASQRTKDFLAKCKERDRKRARNATAAGLIVSVIALFGVVAYIAHNITF